MAQHNDNSYGKGLAIGMIVGGAVGAIVALLLAPKSGAELRRDIAERSSELYDRANDFASDQSRRMNEYLNEGKAKAEEIVKTARQQAGTLMSEAESMMNDARARLGQFTQTNIKDNIGRIQDAAHAGTEAFRQEIQKNRLAPGGETELS
jgi:gas vesicle protein